ncbi:class I SAM-dependent DNA methyltransferase [Wenxinia saemankumensis]|uniref:Methyltransferase domain-containing protein n=1 Tax=Wenxinia saemankumensis TaxID=1447782 RepID=A0A1M6GPV0_9RHOB|nr:class I SAM-dependent methyltransferase [Wenxinia saemankumensis]SHJ12007.1 Methyltransferase domain-containing protein [Wenxinia saemankumensis]
MSTPGAILTTYDSVADLFDAQRDRSLYERRWLDRWLGTAPRGAGGTRVLDLGCGTGRPIAAYLAERGAAVTGVDGAPRMLERFRANVPAARAVEADMRGLQLGERFDAILAWDSFFHLAAGDQRAMFGTFAGHAAPRAALMFTSGTSAGTAMGEVGGQPVFHESLDPDEYRALLDEAGFAVVDMRMEDPDCGGRTVWLCRARPAP